MSVALTDSPDSNEIKLTKADLARRRMRSIAIAVTLGFLALMFYLVTIVKLGGNVLNRAL